MQAELIEEIGGVAKALKGGKCDRCGVHTWHAWAVREQDGNSPDWDEILEVRWRCHGCFPNRVWGWIHLRSHTNDPELRRWFLMQQVEPITHISDLSVNANHVEVTTLAVGFAREFVPTHLDVEIAGLAEGGLGYLTPGNQAECLAFRVQDNIGFSTHYYFGTVITSSRVFTTRPFEDFPRAEVSFTARDSFSIRTP